MSLPVRSRWACVAALAGVAGCATGGAALGPPRSSQVGARSQPGAVASEPPPGEVTAPTLSAPVPGEAGAVARPLPSLANLPPPPQDAAARRAWLKTRLDEVFEIPPLAGAKVSAVVTEFDSGKPIYGRAERVGLNAASNVKLVTSAAALALLGPEHRFRTTIYGPGRANERWLGAGGELAGDLYLRGGGDPTLSSEDLDELARELAALGLKRVRGALVVDASYFDGGAIAPGYDQKQESAAFRAPSSAASLNANSVAITIVPAATAGAPARVVAEPASPYLVVNGRVLTASKGPAVPSIDTADTGSGQTRIDVSGRVKLGSEPRTYLRRIVHPELYLAHTFREVLARRGIVVDKPVRVDAMPRQGFRALSAHDSPPLAVIVHELNKRSSNFTAEQLVRALGAEVVGQPGTWDKGLEAIARYLESIGIARGSYRMTNGAGLYDSNRFSAEQLATVLRAAMRDFRISSEYLASLSVAGTDGTLVQRMGSTIAERYVRAKTGTLLGASCLSGVAGAPGQKPVVFSVLMNDLTSPADARAAQDRASELLVWYLDPSAKPTPAAAATPDPAPPAAAAGGTTP